MSYRRKAPAASAVPVVQKLRQLGNSSIGGIPFQYHNSVALLEQMKLRQPNVFAKFSAGAQQQCFFAARGVSPEQLKESAVEYVLPLPTYFVDPNDSADSFEPRRFFHSSALLHPEKVTCSGYTPRCGLTGLFFSREEVVDNLQAAANDFGFTSPFWIQPSHPGVTSGFLKVRAGSEAVCIGITSNVVSITEVESLNAEHLHSSLRVGKAGGRALTVPDSIPHGMNAFTGFVSENPFFRALPHRGLWVSQSQILERGLKLSKRAESPNGGYCLVEVDQWELFNADQLVVPGRLGLRSCVQRPSDAGVFQPV